MVKPCKDGCGREAVAKGRCRACYNRYERSPAPTEVLPGFMTPKEASARRVRIIREMKQEGYDMSAIAERFGGRTRSGEREEP